MTNRRTKLELTWIGKEHRPRLEPRILVEDPALSYHAKHRVAERDSFDNRLIFGDNLLALKALESELAGQVKCVYIDPPYNTGSAFEHYDDGIEHSLWLSLMRDRLELLRGMLRNDGSIWVSIDDREAHYLKVLGDEIFGRQNFIMDVCWQKRDGPPNDRAIGSVHEHILIWARRSEKDAKKTEAERSFNLLPRTDKANAKYQVYREPTGPDPRGPFRKIDTTANAKGGRHVQSLVYPIRNPHSGEAVLPRKGTNWRHSSEEMERLAADGRLYWGVDGLAKTPMRKLFLDEARAGMATPSIWSQLALNQHASAEMERLFGEKAAFETPKPEALLQRIIAIATRPGDLVLDSFAGSGTTGAVAHKMGRRWVMVELGEHCHTHVIPRLRKVIDGDDPGGVTEATGWKGGGGFRYYRLAPSLLEKDRFGNWVISKAYNPAMLAEALCKLHGFRYEPSEEVYWIHGRSSERDFLWVTTQTLTAERLQQLSDEVGPERSLMVCCGAFRGDRSRWGSLTIEKIPQSVLDRCEWGRDDYSLAVENLPSAPKNEGAADVRAPRKVSNRQLERAAGQTSLFDDEGSEP